MSELASVRQEDHRWRRRKEDRPSEILSAAVKTFSSKGYAATKLVEVAKEAGVSKSTLYLYFESKESLFKAVINEFVVPQIAKAEEDAEQYEGPIKDLMANLLENWRINVLETQLSGIPKIMITETSNFPELADYYLEHVIKRARHFVSKLIEIGIKRGEFNRCDVEFAARTFLTHMIFSAIWKHSFEPLDEAYDLKKYLTFNLDVFLFGILKDKQE